MTQTTALAVIESIEVYFFKIMYHACRIFVTHEFCHFYVIVDGKILLEKQKEFFRKTNYKCANVYGLCPLTYRSYDFQSYRNHIFNLGLKNPKIQ